MKYSILAACALTLIAHVAQGEPVERTVPADPTGTVKIYNLAGEIRIVGWEKPEVRVSGELGREVEELVVERDASRVNVEVEIRKGRHSGAATKLEIYVPMKSTVDAETVSAAISTTNILGEQRLSSVSGNIRAQVLAPEFSAQNVSGDIELSGEGAGVRSTIEAESVSGSIRLNNVGHDVDLNTVNGSMIIHTPELSRARIETTNGSAEIHAALARDARIDAEAINGNIELIFKAAPDAQFDIQTFNGNIRNCFGPKPRRTDEYAPGRELRFQQGSGTARVRIKTLNGGIELCTQ